MEQQEKNNNQALINPSDIKRDTKKVERITQDIIELLPLANKEETLEMLVELYEVLNNFLWNIHKIDLPF